MKFNDNITASKKIAEATSSLIKKTSSPIVIAIDGASGAGKSTFVQAISERLNAVIIPLDDFFAANIPDSKWDEFSVEEKLEKVFNWDRLRTSAIEPLLSGNQACWTTFDFESGIQADGTYKMKTECVTRNPANVMIIEGAYSSSPKITDLLNLSVLIDVPLEERHARLAKREEVSFLKQWHKRWDAVEYYFFNNLRPKESFDIIVELD